MEKLYSPIKNARFLFFTALTGVVLITAVFLFFALADKNKKSANLVLPAESVISKNKITDKDIKNMVVSEKRGENKISISDDIVKEMAASAKK